MLRNTAMFERAYLWPVVLICLILLASGQSQLATPSLGVHLPKDKIGHFLVFGLITTAILRTPRLRACRGRDVLAAILLTSCFGALDEFRQAFTPERHVEFADWVADTLGAVAAAIAYAKWGFYRRLLERPIWELKKGGPVQADA